MDTKNLKIIRGARIAKLLEQEMLEETTYAELERNTMKFVPKTRKRQFVMQSIDILDMEFTPIQHAGNLLVESHAKNHKSETKGKTTSDHAPKILFHDVNFLQEEGIEEGIIDKAKEWWNKRRGKKNANAEVADTNDVQDTEDAKQALDSMDREDPNQDKKPQEEPEQEPQAEPQAEPQDDHQPEHIVQTPGTITIEGKNGKEFTIEPIELTKHNCRVGCNCLDFFWRFAQYADKDESLYGSHMGIYRKKTNLPPVNPQKVPAMCKHILKLAVELKNNGVVK